MVKRLLTREETRLVSATLETRLELERLRLDNQRYRIALRRIISTAPWSGEEGHTQCIKEARDALEQNAREREVK